MGIDVFILGLIALILGITIGFVIRQKHRGAKCIGCPLSKNCNGNCDGKRK